MKNTLFWLHPEDQTLVAALLHLAVMVEPHVWALTKEEKQTRSGPIAHKPFPLSNPVPWAYRDYLV
jgi:hypothetical protein